jgi:hypothetical protein
LRAAPNTLRASIQPLRAKQIAPHTKPNNPRVPKKGASPAQMALRAKLYNLARKPFSLATKPKHLARHPTLVANPKRGETGLGLPLAGPLGGTEQRSGKVGARQRAASTNSPALFERSGRQAA